MVRRGEIYYLDWSPGRGSEQTGFRPGLVIQNDLGNEYSSTTIVAAVSTRASRSYPFHVNITPDDSGLPRPSIVKCDQLQTVDRTRLVRRLGALGPTKMREIDRALLLSLSLDPRRSNPSGHPTPN